MSSLISKISEGDGTTPPGKPKGFWGSILTTTPIALSVLATALGGLSSSEMTRSMTTRSLAAQHQAKAGDQWAFFQAKRIRGTTVEMTIEEIRFLKPTEPFRIENAMATLNELKPLLDSAAEPSQARAVHAELVKLSTSERRPLDILAGGTLPEAVSGAPRPLDEHVEAALRAVTERRHDRTTIELLHRVKLQHLDEATKAAEDEAVQQDQASEPITEAARKFGAELRKLTTTLGPARKRTNEGSSLARTLAGDLLDSFKIAEMELDARRYRREAALNRKIAELYEVQVRRSGVVSDRHRDRSRNFFYGMLIAQLGVIVSSLALSRSDRTLWAVATLPGIAALGFGTYVYVAF